MRGTTNPDGRDDEMWRQLLVEGHRPLALLQWMFRHVPSPPRCKLCYNPFAGIGGRVVAAAGFRPSRKNPNFCVRCCESLPLGGADVDIAVLFADVRNSVPMAAGAAPAAFAATLNRFYLEATEVLIGYDAIIDKLVGDEVMALFIPGIAGRNYRTKSLEAAEALHRRVGHDREAPWIEIGIGVHAGEAFVGNVGPAGVSDFTAFGDTVNTASRLQSVAKAGEIVVTEELWQSVGSPPGSEARAYELKGKSAPVAARVFHPALG